MSSPARPGDLVAIADEDCRTLLAAAPWARIGFLVENGPTVLPINVLLHDGAIYFRTSTGSKLGSAAGTGPVAIQADGGDVGDRVAWSVVAHGHATIVTDPDLEARLLALPFEPWALPDDKPFWVRVDIADISGRRIVRP